MKPTYQYVGLANYKWLTGNGWNKFLTSAGVTVLYTAGEVLITIIGGILLAVLFDCMNRMFKWMRAAIVIPKYVAVSSTAMTFLWLYNDRYGVFNYILSLFGGSGINWLGQKSTALASLIAFGGWRTVGYAMLIYLSAMKGISEEYLEAAAIDGGRRAAEAALHQDSAVGAHHAVSGGDHSGVVHEGVPGGGRVDGRRPLRVHGRAGVLYL